MPRYSGSGTVAGVVFVFFVLVALAVGGVFWAIRDMSADRDATARAEAQADVSRAQIAADLKQAVAEANAAAEAARAAASVEQTRIEWQGRVDQQMAQFNHELALMRESQAEYEKRITILAMALDALGESDQERLLTLMGEQPDVPGLSLFQVVVATGISLIVLLSLLACVLLVIRLVRSWPEPYGGM